MKIGVYSVPLDMDYIEKLKELCRANGHELVFFEGSSQPDTDALMPFEVLCGHFEPDTFKKLPQLKWVHTPYAGVEKLAGSVIPQSVLLTNSSGAFGIAMAEYMLAGILALMRKLPEYAEQQTRRVWHNAGRARCIYESRITVIGTGDIGGSFASRAKALGAHVTGVNSTGHFVSDDFERMLPVSELKTAVSASDVVAVCVPSTPKTRLLISKDIISAMDKNTIFVNCGRGSAVDEEALVQALNSQSIAGAVLDVTAVEPLPEDSPLWTAKNTIITPHVSGKGTDAANTKLIYQIFKDNLERFFSGRPLAHVVDRERGY